MAFAPQTQRRTTCFRGEIHSVKSVLRAPCSGSALGSRSRGSPAALADAVTDWNAYADTINSGAAARAGAGHGHHARGYSRCTELDRPVLRVLCQGARALAKAHRPTRPSVRRRTARWSALRRRLTDVHRPFSITPGTHLPGCPSAACTDGVAAGEAAANAILLLRNGDGSSTPHLPYTLPAAPGVYQPTPVTSATPPPANCPRGAAVRRLGESHAVRAEERLAVSRRAVAALRSQELSLYARLPRGQNRRQVDAETLGNRTADQSEIARFWPGGGANMNLVARIIIAGRGLDLWQHARLFALINMANSDAAVTVFDTKYTHNFWRPVTAIRAAATDTNPFTTPDATWLSYQNTPPYPDYTCGLTNATGSGLAVLRSYFGTDSIAYSLTTPGVSRDLQEPLASGLRVGRRARVRRHAFPHGLRARADAGRGGRPVRLRSLAAAARQETRARQEVTPTASSGRATRAPRRG